MCFQEGFFTLAIQNSIISQLSAMSYSVWLTAAWHGPFPNSVLWHSGSLPCACVSIWLHAHRDPHAAF